MNDHGPLFIPLSWGLKCSRTMGRSRLDGMRSVQRLVLLLLTIPALASAQFSFEDDGKALTLLDEGKPVLSYRYAPLEPPEGMDASLACACFVHPLYGLDGEILTEVHSSADHPHHRGVFWAWPCSTYGGELIDLWLMSNAHPHHVRWGARSVGERARFEAENIWSFDRAPEEAVVREAVQVEVHPCEGDARGIDFCLTLKNAGAKELCIKGQTEAGKGYGGFCVRAPAAKAPFYFATSQGTLDEDALWLESPWADISFPGGPGGAVSGIAVFQHPSNPDYPWGGWLLRHYGTLGASWPHTQGIVLKPGESLGLRYRVIVHRGKAWEAKISELHQAYVEEQKASEEETGEKETGSSRVP